MAGRFMEVVTKQPLLAAQTSKKSQALVDRVLAGGAFRIERAAKRAAPVNYGIMRGAIQAIRDKASLSWTIGTRGLRQAQFVEFGTGPSGKASTKITALAREAMAAIGYRHGPGNFRPPIRAIALWAKRKGIPEEAVFPIARAIGRRGIPAQPFLMPAYERERPGIIAGVAKAIKSAFGL